jgi:hypothetical protein
LGGSAAIAPSPDDASKTQKELPQHILRVHRQHPDHAVGPANWKNRHLR